MIKVKFNGYDCIVDKHKYSNNNRLALELTDANDGESVTVATVNMPDLNLEEGFVVIKNYSENEGLLDVLIEGGIVSTPLFYVPTGFVEVPVCKCLI